MIKYLGTHNSGTGERLIWWQRPFKYILQPFARCQSRTIEEQLKDGIKWFNLQITYYKGQFMFSHGFCIYDYPVDRAIINIKNKATKECPIYITISLDKNFITVQNKEKFYDYIETIKEYCSRNENLKLIYATIEGGITEWVYINNDIKINRSEHYWTSSWSKTKSLKDKIPLPIIHAKKYNYKYIEENVSDYLMLDFYHIQKKE